MPGVGRAAAITSATADAIAAARPTPGIPRPHPNQRKGPKGQPLVGSRGNAPGLRPPPVAAIPPLRYGPPPISWDSAMSLTADRLDRIQPSLTIAISTVARKMIADGKNIISLSQGEPDFDTPRNVK